MYIGRRNATRRTFIGNRSEVEKAIVVCNVRSLSECSQCASGSFKIIVFDWLDYGVSFKS